MRAIFVALRALVGLECLYASVLVIDLSVSCSLAHQPGRGLLQQGRDLIGGERLGDFATGESGIGDAELVGDNGARVRPGLAQLHQPFGWIGDHLVELLA